MTRRVFYSFHYQRDSWRAGKVRNIGVLDGNRPATDNDWETIRKGGDERIRRWIANQMRGRSCTVVLVGAETAGRKWINHEIIKSWNDGMGVVGIRVHGLKDKDECLSEVGRNPFDEITLCGGGRIMSTVAECLDPEGNTSSERCAWIEASLPLAVEVAIRNRRRH